MMRVAGPVLILLLAAGAATAGSPNHVVLELATEDAHVRKATLELLRARLERFGLEAETRLRPEGRVRVDLPALATGQPARVIRLLTSRGEVDLVSVRDGTVVVPASAVRGLATSLVGDRIVFRLRLRREARKRWPEAPDLLALRWDGREVLFFDRDHGATPEVRFPAAYPRDELRALFCCVQYGPLPVEVDVVEKSLDAVTDPALAWARLVDRWRENPPAVEARAVYRRAGDEAVYTATTSTILRDGRTLYRVVDTLRVPERPEQDLRIDLLLDRAWRLVEGEVRTGGHRVALDPGETFLALGVALRLAPLLPPRPGGAFGPGGRLQVRSGPEAGTVEIRSPTRPMRIVVSGGRVASFTLGVDGEAFRLAE